MSVPRTAVDVLIVGCGDTGVRVAARAVAAGERTVGIVRGADSAARVRSVGAEAWQVDLDSDGPAPDLPRCRRLFYFAPPPRQGEHDTRMTTVLAALGDEVPEHLVYISTSGVYGDCQGAWVDEDRPVAAETERARRRVDAERQILAFDERAIVLRAPGIYGPNRLPIDRLRAGTPILDDADGGMSNRVHIDDLAAMAWLAGQRRLPSSIYNACDGAPTTLSAYYDHLAGLLDLAPPPRISWAEAERQFSAMRLSFLRESRRLSNARFIADTGYRMLFADYRDGLAASLKAEPADSST